MAGEFWGATIEALRKTLDALNRDFNALSANFIGNITDDDWLALVDTHPEDPKLQPGTRYDTYKRAVAQEGEMNRKKFLGQYDNPADEYALKTKSPVDSRPTEPISQWLRPK